MKNDTKQALIEAAAPLIHRQGFHRTGLKEILSAAGVPKGSFYFYFKSKEDFGLALIDHYSREIAERGSSGPLPPGEPALLRLRRTFEIRRDGRAECGCQGGCPLGNLAQEVSDLSPVMREHLQKALNSVTSGIEALLRLAVERGELPAETDPAQTAAFILDAWEGALMRMKAEKSVEPLDRFIRFVFDRLLA